MLLDRFDCNLSTEPEVRRYAEQDANFNLTSITDEDGRVLKR
jgi:hypothetical protein